MTRSRRPTLLVLAALALLLMAGACQGRSGEQDLDAELRAIIAARGLTGDPSRGRDLPAVEEPLAQLGKKLFYTKALGGDRDTACASCHSPLLGGGDGLRLPIGAGADDPARLGPGRTHPDGYAAVPRNAPTTFNVALWDRALFHDGRVESLGKTPGARGADGRGIRTPDVPFGQVDPDAGEDLVAAQSRFPPTSVEEMRGAEFEAGRPNQAVRQHLAARLGGYGVGQGELAGSDWPAEFMAVFGRDLALSDLVTDAHIARALSAFQSSQVLVDTPWRAFVGGDEGALSTAAKRGALLFMTPVAAGGAGCATCHTGDFFTDEGYHVLAVPQIGVGKGNGPTGDDDFGRFRETGDPADLYAFRTPSLVNVTVTGPYGHDGAYESLEAMVGHHLDPAAAVAGFDFAGLEADVHADNALFNSLRALARLKANRAAGRPDLVNADLDDRQIADLLDFLHALTDPCVEDPACLAPWLPGPADRDPDGLRLDVG